MHLPQPVIKKGFFYSPLDSTKQYPGLLTISDGGTIELELTTDDLAFTPYDEDRIGRLIGHVSDGYVTLDGCIFVDRGVPLGEPVVSRIKAHTAFDGVGMHDTEKYTALTFGIDGLSEWWNKSAFKFQRGERFSDTTMTVAIPEPVVVTLADKTRFKLYLDAAIPGGHSFPTLTLRQQARIKLVSEEPQEFEYFRSLAHRITRFFAFVIGRAVAIHSVNVELDDPDLSNLEKWLPVYYASTNFPNRVDTKSIGPRNIIISYATIAERFESTLRNWLTECDNLGPALHHYYLVQDGASSYAEIQFISMAQALEAFHRRTTDLKIWSQVEFDEKIAAILMSCPEDDREWLGKRLTYANEVSLSMRIQDLFAPYKDAFGGNRSVKSLVSKTTQTRNYHAHYDPAGAVDAVHGSQLVALTYRLRVLFALCVSARLGLSVEETRKLTEAGPLEHLLKSAAHIDEQSKK